MGEKTGISWCDHTFNPWIGCCKVSPGCTNCYAERDNRRFNWVNGWGPKGERKRTSEANRMKVYQWDIDAGRAGIRRKVFCASLADVFEDREELVPWRRDLWDLIDKTKNLDWLLLTKRPENIVWMLPDPWRYDDPFPPNLWLGTTCENQKMYDERLPFLLENRSPVRFISAEPLLSQIHMISSIKTRMPDWVIVGGESGINARPMDPAWAIRLRDQCYINGIPFFFKQMGGFRRIDGHWGGDKLLGHRYQQFPKARNHEEKTS